MASGTSAAGRLSRGRRRTVRALVVVGSILAFLSILSIWLERQVLNTDDWVSTSTQLIEDETIRTAISEYLVDELYANVDMESELEKILPDPVKGLAGPAAGGIRQGAGQATERILRTGTAKSLWEAANRAAHAELVVVLEGGDERLSTEGGVVTLDLGGMLGDLGRQIGLSESLTDKIPDEAGRIEILRSDELKTAQQVARVVKGLALVLFLLTLLSFGLAVYLSAGQRWIALLSSSVGLVAAAFAVIIVRRVAGNLIVSQLVEDPGVKPAAENAWSIATSLLASIATSVIVFAILLALAAWLAAPAPSSRQVRRFLSPGLRDHMAYFYAGLAVIAGLWLLFSPGQNLRSLLTVIMTALLAAFGLRELRRMSLAEYPDEPAWTGLERMRTAIGRSWQGFVESRRRNGTGDTGDSATAATERLPEAQDEAATEVLAGNDTVETAGSPVADTGPQPVADVPGQSADIDEDERRLRQLERLAALYERGVLNEEELAAEKARLLGK